MANSASVWSAVITALGSAGIGYVGAAAITARSQRKSKIDEAQVLVEVATEITDGLLRRNRELAHINAGLRRALQKLTVGVQIAQDTFERFPETGDSAANRSMMALLQEALDIANSVEF